MNRPIGSRSLLLPLLLLAACAAARVERESDLVLARDRAWSAVASEGRDVDALLDFWAEDAVLIAPEQPVMIGRDAIRAYVEASLALPGFHIEWESSEPVVAASGDMAWLASTNHFTVPGANGELVQVDCRAITVWRKDADGLWRCVADIWNAPAQP